MNLHVDRMNPLCRRALIVLDGKQVKNCTEADDEHGYIYQLEPVHDFRGNVIDYRSVRHEGKVRIVDPLEWTLDKVYLRCDRE